jgi:hypothetical protein
MGVRWAKNDEIEFCAPFGLQTLIAGEITYNAKRARIVFDQGLEKKQWLTMWPKLRVEV